MPRPSFTQCYALQSEFRFFWGLARHTVTCHIGNQKARFGPALRVTWVHFFGCIWVHFFCNKVRNRTGKAHTRSQICHRGHYAAGLGRPPAVPNSSMTNRKAISDVSICCCRSQAQMDCFWPWPTIPPRRTTPQTFERATPLAQGIVSFMTMFLERTPVRNRSLPTATGIPFCASSTPNGGSNAKSGRVVCLLHMPRLQQRSTWCLPS